MKQIVQYPVVFLDIDGVLNVYGTKFGDEVWSSPLCKGISRHLVVLLNRITDATGARIVVSSSWRNSNDPAVEVALFDAGVTAYMTGRTGRAPMGCSYQRGWEIAEWLNEHPEVQDYVVLDDETCDMDNLPPYRIVDVVNGLTEANVAEAIRILNGLR